MTDCLWGTATVVKRNKRLCIVLLETDELLYSPPDFIKLPNREPLKTLAYLFTQGQRRCIDSIMAFESVWSRE